VRAAAASALLRAKRAGEADLPRLWRLAEARDEASGTAAGALGAVAPATEATVRRLVALGRLPVLTRRDETAERDDDGGAVTHALRRLVVRSPEALAAVTRLLGGTEAESDLALAALQRERWSFERETPPPEVPRDALPLALALLDRPLDGRRAGRVFDLLQALRPEFAAVHPAARRVLDSPDPWVAREALFFLSTFGTQAKDALPRIEELLEDDDRALRDSRVEEAVQRILGGSDVPRGRR
jgi:hypothetical protein